MRALKAGLLGLMLMASAIAPALAQPAEDDGGVTVRRPSLLRYFTSAERIEKTAAQQFVTLKGQAETRRALLPKDDPQSLRVRRLAKELLPYATKWNPRAKDWQWDVVVIKSKTINAFCMPGGKIAFFTGILETLNLTDDETAIVMGHEMAHALREHARTRSVKQTIANVSAFAAAVVLGDNYGQLAQVGGGLLNLRFGRDDERDADLIGMEMAARAGYNPEAGLTLWEKMSKAQKGSAPPPWLSTHPSHDDRIARMRKALPKVLPLYEKARAAGLPAKASAN